MRRDYGVRSDDSVHLAVQARPAQDGNRVHAMHANVKRAEDLRRL